MTPRDLTAEEIAAAREHAEQQMIPGEANLIYVDGPEYLSALAMASSLLELEAALVFLDRGDGNRGTHGSDMRAPALLSLARVLGFPGLNAKGGENG